MRRKTTYLETFHAPADNYMFDVNNRNTRTSCDICSQYS